MDGLDGLLLVAWRHHSRSGVCPVPWPLWAWCSLLGFAWNRSPAKVFMGDVSTSWCGVRWPGPSGPWLETGVLSPVATPLLADACFCVLRRWFAGQRVPKPTVFICSSACTRPAGLIPGCPLHISQLQSCWHWPCLPEVGLGVWPAVAELLFGVWLDQRVAVSFSVASKS